MSERYRMPVDPSAANNPHSFALEMVGGDRRVLELGCASGHVTEKLVAAGNEVVGVESDAAWAAEAERFAKVVHVLDIDIDSVSEAVSGRFDAIVAGDVLEHLRDPLAVLTDVLTLLEPGGDVIISVPNMAYIDVRLLLLEGRVEYQDEGLLDRTHLRWFTRASLWALLNDAGLSAVDVRRVVHPIGSSRLPVDWDVHGETVRSFILADPEALTYQFVVRCRRSAELSGETPDALAVEPHSWPIHTCDDTDAMQQAMGEMEAEHSALRAEIEALEATVDAWERSRTARLTRPIRTLLGRIRNAR